MKTTNYLILLTETERSMVQEALTHYIQNPFLGTSNWVSESAREKIRTQMTVFLETIKKFYGGLKTECLERNLYFLKESLVWYGSFLPVKDDMNDYVKLGYILEGRNKNMYLFNFNPNNYDPKESKPIIKKDFTKIRYLIARETEGKIDFLAEIFSKPKESDEKYKKRAEEIIKNKNAQYEGNWLLVNYNDIQNMSLAPDCSYHCN